MKSAVSGYIDTEISIGVIPRVEFWAVYLGLGLVTVLGSALVTVGSGRRTGVNETEA